MELASNTPYTLKLASTIEMESQKVDPTRAYLPSRLLKNEEGTPEEIWNELLCIKCGRLPLTPMMCRGCQAVLCATCRYISCPNCQIKGWIKEISEEKQGDFAEIMVDCKYVGYGCKLLSKLSGLLLHERECKYAPTQCRLCGKLIPQVGYAQHLNICPSKVVTCDLCNGKFLLQDMPTHNHLKTLLSQIGNHRVLYIYIYILFRI